jgi:ketosteroid isomerase-like protein
MSQENVEIIRRLYEAFNGRDFAGAALLVHPEGEVYPGVVGPDAEMRSQFCGRDEVRQFFEATGEVWESVTVEVREIVPTPDGRLLVFENWHTCGRGGIEVDTKVIDVYEFRDGLIVRVDGFLDEDEARKAAGLPE